MEPNLTTYRIKRQGGVEASCVHSSSSRDSSSREQEDFKRQTAVGMKVSRVMVYVFNPKNASYKNGHYSTHARTIETWNTALCSQEQQGDWVFSISLFFFSLKITASKKIVCFKVIRRRRPVFKRSRTRLISRATEVDGRRTAYQENR